MSDRVRVCVIRKRKRERGGEERSKINGETTALVEVCNENCNAGGFIFRMHCALMQPWRERDR